MSSVWGKFDFNLLSLKRIIEKVHCTRIGLLSSGRSNYILLLLIITGVNCYANSVSLNQAFCRVARFSILENPLKSGLSPDSQRTHLDTRSSP